MLMYFLIRSFSIRFRNSLCDKRPDFNPIRSRQLKLPLFTSDFPQYQIGLHNLYL